MISLLTNIGAMAAGQALSSASAESASLRNRLATGLKVASVRDDGATWAIAQGMRSELSGWKVAREAMARTQSILDVTGSALEGISDTLMELRTKAIAYGDDSLDARSKALLMADMKDLVASVDSRAQASSFDGINLLTPGNLDPISITPSSSGAQANFMETIPMSRGPGILSLTLTVPGSLSMPNVTVQGAGGGGITVHFPARNAAYQTVLPLDYGDATDPASIGPAQVTYDFHSTPKPTSNPQGFRVESVSYTPLTETHDTLADPNGGSVRLASRPVTAEWLGLTGIDQMDAGTLLATVDNALAQTNRTAAIYGSQSASIGRRMAQAAKLADTLEAGVGNIVDADLSKDSAKLQASQVREQLATKTLAIAGQQAAWMLGLFARAA